MGYSGTGTVPPVATTEAHVVHAIIVMYDITDVDSYEHVKMWLNDIDRYASDNVVKLLVGNKCDLETKRVVEYQTANAFANEIEIPFIETSAKNSTNISDAFGIMVNSNFAFNGIAGKDSEPST